MDWLVKILTPDVLLSLLPMILLRLGSWFKGKDLNDTGADDAFGNILIGLAPAIVAIETKNESALKKALKATYITLGGYLGYPPPPA